MEVILNSIDQIGLSVILTFLLLFFIIYYSYSACEYDYWKKQGVPGETAWPIVGTFKPKFIYQRMELLDQENHKKYGKIYGGFEGRKAALYVIDPDLIKQVMVKDFPSFMNRRTFEGFSDHPVFGKMLSTIRNDEWKMTRVVLTPTFTTGKIKQMAHLMEDCAKILTNSLSKIAETNEPIDMKHYFSGFTLDVIARCVFAMKTNSVENPDNEFIVRARNSFQIPAIFNLFMFAIPELFWIVQKTVCRLGKDPFDYFIKLAGNVINLRLEQKSKSIRKDFLDLLIEAEREEEGQQNDRGLDSTPINKKKIMTRTNMIANSVMFLVAGQETTSTALSFFAYCLATNPNVQDKLIEEIDDAITECKGHLPYEVIQKLPYLDMALSETLRMYPPANRIERACGVESYKLGNIVMKKEAVFITSVYSLHHDEDLYPNPEVFDPER